MTDDRQPHEPIVPNPAHDPADEPFPGEGQDDDDGTSEISKEWDEQVAEEAGITEEESNPVPPT